MVRRLGRPKPEPDPVEVAEGADLLAALRKLPPDLATAMVLRHYHGYSNRELGYVLGISERTIGSRLARARLKLRTELGPDWGSLPTSGPADVDSYVSSEVGDA